VGPNFLFRVRAEVPYDDGLFLSFDLGMDAHGTGFGDALVMPVFAVGVGFLR
jgi:hypothetical protein